MKTSLESISQTHFASSSILFLFMKKAHDQLLFFYRKEYWYFQIFNINHKCGKSFIIRPCTPLVPCFTFQILLFESFYKVLTSMNKILRIWRYVTIGVIVSLLTLSIFVLGCTTDSIPNKNKNSAVMNDPIVTYWYCW